MIAAAVVLLACGQQPSTTPADPVEPETSPEARAPGAEEPAEARPFTYAPGEPGPAYFAVRGEGVVMLDDGALTRVEGSTTEHVFEIARGRDGSMYLLDASGISRLEGASLERVAPSPSDGAEARLTDVAVDVDGTIWGVGWKSVSFWNGTSWSTQGESVLGPDVSLPHAVAIDGRGRVWVASLHALHVREDGKWQVVDISRLWDRAPAFDGVETGPGGVAIAAATDGLLELSSPSMIERVQVDDDLLIETLGCSARGVLGFRYNVDEIVRIGVDGTKTFWRAKEDFAAAAIDEVAPDDSGRVWVATDVGLVILGPGREKAEWRSGSVVELAGRIDEIGVAGAGPALPTEVGPVQKGGLAGRLVRNGKPLARAMVELCPHPSVASKPSPCAASATRVTTTTDADGRFAVKDVPLGLYGLAVKTGTKWHHTHRPEHRVREPGRDHDLGEIKIQAEDER